MTDARAEMLARLMGRAQEEGAALTTLRALVEEASEAGAVRALERLGLNDQRARSDIDELRELLRAWRDAKRSAGAAAAAWVVRLLLAALLIGLAVKLELTGMLTR